MARVSTGSPSGSERWKNTNPETRHHREVQPPHQLLLKLFPVFDAQSLDGCEGAWQVALHGLGILVVVDMRDHRVILGLPSGDAGAGRAFDLLLIDGCHYA